ncbi:DUF5695 domain-containing protein [Mucilaginibacter sp. UR6-1]|uniref:DUF5695 domain-containing protein n=1 Tax=Mucilaginibacter sp. UR6-1 TaxID=1435643 RepID=UPI001E43A17D|nr:DUF5695 domain-containing protein [Mucilaginibacter sp. UR6-1]MCC8407435.1 DUF5695 domain-containing protein [Mucilaginibacter sp. UR6-1]
MVNISLPPQNNINWRTAIFASMLMFGSLLANAQNPWEVLSKRPSTLGIESGIDTYSTSAFNLKLVKASQTVAGLEPKSSAGFDYIPADRLKQRSSNGMYQLGDINIRLKTEGDTAWKSFSSASKRAPVKALAANDSVLSAADLAATLPADIPLKIERLWKQRNGQLILEFDITNTSNKAVEIGSLGMPMIFNNILQDKSLEKAHAECVFYDPYIGSGAGYLQVTRLSGQGPALLVVPDGDTPFEAYNPLLDDPTPRGIDFEGFYEWMVHSKAYADKEWKKAEPWNEPTAFTLKPGETRRYAVKFILADAIRNIEKTLIVNNRPVAMGVPGYIIPQDVDGKLFLNYNKEVTSIKVQPAGALTFTKAIDAPAGWLAYQVKGNVWGRARVTVTYADGLKQTISYKVIKPEEQVVKDFGNFLTTKQWYHNDKDLFGRSNSVITYDYEKKAKVLQDSRAWIVGLSDEGGAGSWLGAMMKEVIQPDKAEVQKLQLFVNHTIWGGLQHSQGKEKYGVKKSLYYYDPKGKPAGTYSDSINYKTWAAWDKKGADDIGRSYNYPHVAAAHWALYRLARNHKGLVSEYNWQWYLTNAYGTSMAMITLAPYYAQFGQMEGTVFYLILQDLKAEGWGEMAGRLEAAMRKRADHWRTLQYPFGSEMPWDSTGQEEVYVWSKYFGYNDKALVTLNAVLGYMPTVPHWGYNGSARRYWDFLYGGKLSRVERQLHHYGSGLNAIPVLTGYRSQPDDLYLLRVGYGGTLGAISNITEDGFGPAAFHSFPSTLRIDYLSGDYGPNFFGYAVNTATYIANDATFGWLAFGGNLTTNGDVVNVAVTTAAKSKVFIAPLKLWLTLDAGQFKTISYNKSTGAVSFMLDKADAYTPVAYLHVEGGENKYRLPQTKVRGAYVIKLSSKTASNFKLLSN